MKEELDFSLPNDNKIGQSGRRFTGFPTIVSIIVIIVMLGFIVQEIYDQLGKRNHVSPSINPEEEKALAKRLEDRNLSLPAAQAWIRYMSKVNLTDTEKANYYYRIGRLFHDGKFYDRALEYYYRSELTAKVPDIELEMNRRKQECFQKLGNFSGLDRELKAMTSIGGAEAVKFDEEIIAEIGERKITDRELERQISTYIDIELGRYKPVLNPDELEREKERLYDQFKQNDRRLQFLNQIIAYELLNREANHQKFDTIPENIETVQWLINEFYAQKVLEKMLKERVVVTESDLKDYYDAHIDEFTEKEKANISLISVDNEETANKVLEELKTGTSFEETAKKYNSDELLINSGGKIDGKVEKGGSIPGFGYDSELNAHIFALGEGKFSDKPIKRGNKYYIFRVDSLMPATVKSFDEVRRTVEIKKRRLKEQESYNSYIEELKKKHKVLIHFSSFSQNKGTEKDTDTNSSDKSK